MTTPQPRAVWHLDTTHIGRHVHYFDQLDSTNTTAVERAGPEYDSLVVIANYQTAGRGQYGRVWQARPGSSLLMSVALKPPRQWCRPVILTALAAIAIGETVYSLTGEQARIKWPNDLLVRGRKVCGILIEQHAETTVIGVGLNLTQSAEEFAAAGLPDAVSLQMLSRQSFATREAADVAIRCLDREYGRLLAGERVAIEADWKWRIGLLGRMVTVELADCSTVRGRLVEMGFDQVELDSGGSRRFIVPEIVRHLGPLIDSV